MLVKSEIISIFNDVFQQKARTRKGGSQLTYHCPFCADKNPITQKLEIAIDGPNIGNFHCWRCNCKGKTFGSLLKKLKAPSSYRTALFNLTGDIKLLKSKKIKSNDSVIALPEEFCSLAVPKNCPEYKNAMAYLKSRGVLYEDILRYNIGYCDNGPYEHHVIIPSYDAKCELNFFIGRRYYTADMGIPHKKPDVSMNLVGFESFINYNEPLILVEGAFNAITIRRNAIPLFGKFPSKKLQETMIVNNVRSVYVFLDEDAQKESISLCEQLIRLGITPYMVNACGGKDANEIGFKKSWECIKNAEEVDFSFLLKKKLKL